MAKIEFRVGGQILIVEAQEHETILDCALRHAVNAPYSCLEGVCGTCKARILQGDFDLPAGTAEELAEAQQGKILTCQAHLRKGCQHLVVDYDI